MGLLLQCDLGNNRDLEYINTSGCLLWGRQFWSTIAIWSVDAWRGFSILKDKCNFIPTENAIHLMILSNCSQVTGPGSSPWQARERSRWQWQSGRRQGLPAVPEPASIIGVSAQTKGLVTWEVGAIISRVGDGVSLSPDCVESTGIKCTPSCDEKAKYPVTATEPQEAGTKRWSI